MFTISTFLLVGFAQGPGALGEIAGPEVRKEGVIEATQAQAPTLRWGEGGLGPKPPQIPLTPEERERLKALKALNKIGSPHWPALPSDPAVNLDEIKPSTPPITPLSMETMSQSGTDSDFVFFEKTQGPQGIGGGWPPEPSVGTCGRVIAYCGNTYGLISSDHGDTFTQVNPNTLFSGNICCDQVMYYDERHELFLWLMQGARTGANNENLYTLAWAVGMEDLVDLNFTWMTFDPQNHNQAAGTWWDFPEMTVSNDHLWFHTNNIGGGDSVIVKVPLDEMRFDDGNVAYSFFELPDIRVRLIQGMTTVMYGACHVDNNTQRVYRSVASGSTIDWVSRDIDAWSNGNSTAPGPDGVDWFSGTENSTHTIRGATCTNDEVFFFWESAQTGGYPFPYWCISRYSRNDSRSYNGSNVVWSDLGAWAYASGHVNDRSHMGGTATFGGGTYYPSSVAWILDDYTGTDAFNIDSVFVYQGTDGPPVVRWGDYLTARRHTPYGNTWVGTGFTNQGAGWGQEMVDYSWFGRRRDEPASQRTIYVGDGVTSTWQDGTSGHPYDGVGKGQFAGDSGDTVLIEAGAYDETGTFDRPVLLEATGGTVVIQ
jgi:hypothetical protein